MTLPKAFLSLVIPVLVTTVINLVLALWLPDNPGP
jgi:hypothetical protein